MEAIIHGRRYIYIYIYIYIHETLKYLLNDKYNDLQRLVNELRAWSLTVSGCLLAESSSRWARGEGEGENV